MLIFRLNAVLSHVQSSSDVCWWAEKRGVLLFLACWRVDHMCYCMVYNLVAISCASHCSLLSKIIVEAEVF
jgi:hypothetical protein